MVGDGKIIYPDLSYLVYGLCFKVHNELGRFRSEKSYADALELLFKKHGVRYLREEVLAPSFEGEHTGRNIPDFVIEEKIVLDVKAKRIVTKEDYFQMRRYLEAGRKKLGLIVNFRQMYLAPKRVAS